MYIIQNEYVVFDYKHYDDRTQTKFSFISPLIDWFAVSLTVSCCGSSRDSNGEWLCHTGNPGRKIQEDPSYSFPTYESDSAPSPDCVPTLTFFLQACRYCSFCQPAFLLAIFVVVRLYFVSASSFAIVPILYIPLPLFSFPFGD